VASTSVKIRHGKVWGFGYSSSGGCALPLIYMRYSARNVDVHFLWLHECMRLNDRSAASLSLPTDEAAPLLTIGPDVSDRVVTITLL
jgi:hypothetical protein